MRGREEGRTNTGTTRGGCGTCGNGMNLVQTLRTLQVQADLGLTVVVLGP